MANPAGCGSGSIALRRQEMPARDSIARRSRGEDYSAFTRSRRSGPVAPCKPSGVQVGHHGVDTHFYPGPTLSAGPGAPVGMCSGGGHSSDGQRSRMRTEFKMFLRPGPAAGSALASRPVLALLDGANVTGAHADIEYACATQWIANARVKPGLRDCLHWASDRSALDSIAVWHESASLFSILGAALTTRRRAASDVRTRNWRSRHPAKPPSMTGDFAVMRFKRQNQATSRRRRSTSKSASMGKVAR